MPTENFVIKVFSYAIPLITIWFIASPAIAENWVRYGPPTGGGHMDKDSAKRTGDLATIIISHFHAPNGWLMTFDCERQLVRGQNKAEFIPLAGSPTELDGGRVLMGQACKRPWLGWK